MVRRYQLAFEAGMMAAEDCGPRVQELSNQIRDLRAREVELKEGVDAHRQFEVTDELLDQAAREIEVALLTDGRRLPQVSGSRARGSYCRNFGGPGWTRTTYLRV